MRLISSTMEALVIIVISCVIGAQSITCPEDSIATESGECKCLSPCPPNKCKQGERPVELRAASPNIPGSCCPIYDCVPSEPVSWDDTDDSNLIKNCIDHNGIPRTIGEHWDQNPCVNCSCEESNGKATVSCHATMCKSCERPAALQPGQCCPNCLELTNDTNTITIDDTTTAQVPISECASLDNCDLPCHLGPEDDNGCPICQCPDLESTTRQPTDPTDKICPELPHCGLNCVLVKDQGGCPVCACEDSIESDVSVVQANVQPNEVGDDGRIVCPELKCDLHCERGLVMDDNDCTVCQCKPNNSWCPGIISGCKRICPQGYKINKRGCLTCRCRTTCTDHRNETHPEGTSWQPDECTSCTCDQFGRLICKETVCSVACTNPLPPKPGTCCPVCPISENASSDHHVSRSWGIIPITLIAILTLLVIILMMYVVRGRFRGRLSPSSTTYATYPAQYYKCVPSYETPVHRSEKVVPL